jgi:Ser/Thr protein kinase RdoA (MazF antagonist)
LDDLFPVAARFVATGGVIDVRGFGSGNINDTFLVTLDEEAAKHFIMQRINTHVFRRPELIMQNMKISTAHMLRHRVIVPLKGGRRWEVPFVLPTKDGRDYWVDSDGSFWRAISFIEGSQTFDTVKDARHAGEVGYALGIFHALLSDLPPERLADTLEGFHVTPGYLRHYDEVMAGYGANGSPEVRYCIRSINERREWAHVLEDAKAAGRLVLRTVHGDPKVNNVLLDAVTGLAVGIVDLDTVKPGLIHYDIGDCLRSGCNLLGEETEDWEKVRFDTDICRAILGGYLPVSGEFFTLNDFEYLYDSIRLIAFELGLRFFTDYLEGNIYFKVKRLEQNLARALVQFRLTEGIESKASEIQSIIRDFR